MNKTFAWIGAALLAATFAVGCGGAQKSDPLKPENPSAQPASPDPSGTQPPPPNPCQPK